MSGLHNILKEIDVRLHAGSEAMGEDGWKYKTNSTSDHP